MGSKQSIHNTVDYTCSQSMEGTISVMPIVVSSWMGRGMTPQMSGSKTGFIIDREPVLNRLMGVSMFSLIEYRSRSMLFHHLTCIKCILGLNPAPLGSQQFYPDF